MAQFNRVLRLRLPELGCFLLLAAAYACGARDSSRLIDDVCADRDDCLGPDGEGPGSEGAGGASSDGDSTGSGSSNGSAANGGEGSLPGGAAVTAGPHFSGSGSGFRPLTPGCGPETAGQCTGSCEQGQGAVPTQVIRPAATLCFSGEGDPTPDDPAVVIEQVIERSGDREYVHARVTFDPSFTDNTYGEGSCCGWPERRGHRFGDLTGSDHTELLLTDAGGNVAMNFKIDLITASADSQCGYGTLGVSGGDGSLIAGNAEHVLAVATSADRNLNGCGYCESPACGPSGDCTVDSPATDESYTPAPETPNWDYRQVYEVWIDTAAFGDSGFGQAFITYTHSSPAKSSTDTVNVEPSPCPPSWDTPYCPPSVLLEGGNCFGSPPDGSGGAGGSGSGGSAGAAGTGGSGTAGSAGATGTGGSGSGGSSGEGGSGTAGSAGSTGTGGSGTAGSSGTGGSTSTGGTGGSSGGGGGEAPCPPNQQVYITTEGASLCTPIPFANYPGMAPCPEGYTLDLASEGQYCLPN